MAGSLNILVVDDRPDSVLFLTEFLLSRKHRVSTIANGKEALAAVQRKRAAGDGFDLVITEISIPGMDGMALLKDLRRRQEPIESAICTAYASLHPNLRQEAERLGCLMVLEKPTDLALVDELLQLAQSRRRTSPGTTKSDQPFFGTSRIVRNDDITTSRLRREQGQPGTGHERRSSPSEGLERRTPAAGGGHEPIPLPSAPPPARMPSPLPMEEGSDRHPRRQAQSFSHSSAPSAPPEPPPAPAASMTGSGRVERPPAAIPLAPEAIAVPRPGEASAPGDPSKPLAPVTTRLRRSISGTERITRQAPPQPPAGTGVPEGSRAVGCALCGKPFVVLDKPQTYSVVCVHCGQLNRVEPLTPPAAG